MSKQETEPTGSLPAPVGIKEHFKGSLEAFPQRDDGGGRLRLRGWDGTVGRSVGRTDGELERKAMNDDGNYARAAPLFTDDLRSVSRLCLPLALAHRQRNTGPPN